MSAQYPTVPDAPGVPAVQRPALGGTTPQSPALVSGSGRQAQADISASWGIYSETGAPLATFDNIVSFELQLDSQILDYPVEGGGFISANKVLRPFDTRVIATKGGSVEARQAVLGAVQSAWQTTDLYSVVTPDGVYLNCNIVGMRRQASPDHGAYLLVLEIDLRNVRQTATTSFSNVAAPASAAQAQNGAAQAQPSDAASTAAGETQ